MMVVTQILFAFSFLIVRWIFGVYFSYGVWKDLFATKKMGWKVKLVYLAANIALNGLNFVWGWLIVKKLVRAINNKDE